MYQVYDNRNALTSNYLLSSLVFDNCRGSYLSGRISISNSIFQNSPVYYTSAIASITGSVTGCSFSNLSGLYILWINGIFIASIAGNRFTNVNAQYALYITTCTVITLSSNIFSNNNVTYNINLESTTPTRSLAVTGNQMVGCVGGGMVSTSRLPVLSVTLSSNTCQNNTGACFDFGTLEVNTKPLLAYRLYGKLIVQQNVITGNTCPFAVRLLGNLKYLATFSNNNISLNMKSLNTSSWAMVQNNVVSVAIAFLQNILWNPNFDGEYTAANTWLQAAANNYWGTDSDSAIYNRVSNKDWTSYTYYQRHCCIS